MTLTDFLLARIAEDEAFGHVSHPDPVVASFAARVLADCEAVMRIVEAHACRELDVARPICDVCWDDTFMGHADYPCGTLRILASIYADHPDYQEAWKP